MSGSYTPVSRQDDDDTTPSSLSESLVGIPQGQSLPLSQSTPVIQVVAPATLPEGYQFETTLTATTPGEPPRTLTVTVPPGGIEQGQTFSVEMPSVHRDTMISGISIPVGHWRDGLFTGIFNYGPCHPSCWTGCCCHLLAAGQVIRRLKLAWNGRPGTPGQQAAAFKIIFAATVLYFSIYIGFSFLMAYLDPNTYTPPNAPPIQPGGAYMFVASTEIILRYGYWIITTLVLTNLRTYVRNKYAIPTVWQGHDCCLSFWCPCFVAPQLLRHTTDYDVHPSYCCTETGLPPHAPSIV